MTDRKTNPFFAEVRAAMEAADQVQPGERRFDPKLIGLYTGLQLEELREKLEVIAAAAPRVDIYRAPGFRLFDLIEQIRGVEQMFKQGVFWQEIANANREKLADGDIDLAVVTTGSLVGQGVDVDGAAHEVTRANLDKRGPDGKMMRDANGKYTKPPGWKSPELEPFLAPVIR